MQISRLPCVEGSSCVALQLGEGRWRSIVQCKCRLQGLTCRWASGWNLLDTACPAKLRFEILAVFGD